MSRSAEKHRGFTLIELLLALLLGAVLLAGTLQLFGGIMRSYRTLQTVIELEDRASFALRELATDARLAGYIRSPAGDTPALPAGARCAGRDVGTWAGRFAIAVEAAGNGGGLPCPARGGPADNSDTLTIRHLDPYTLDPPWQANVWYVDTRSSEADMPGLYRQTLMPDGRVQNQEIMPGVEQLQVQLGIDSDGDHLIDTFATPSAAVTGDVMALMLTLAVRTAVREPTLAGDGYRRLTAQRLVALRNALPN